MSQPVAEIRINGEAANKALESLRRHAEKPRKNRSQSDILGGDIIHLVIGVKKVKKEWGSDVIHCDLVHSLDERDSTIENVFISKGDSAPWASKLQSTGKISTYMSFEQMKKEIESKDGKAKFLKSFRYILCDNRLRRGMAHLFGDPLLKKRKIIPVRIFQNDLESIISNINLQLKATHVVFSGTCLDIKIGRTKMTNKEIVENYNATMVALLQWLKAEDVLSMALKTEESVSFPIYQVDAVVHKAPYVRELTLEEKRKLKYKEKRLKRVNAGRVKKEVVPKIKPKKPLSPVC